jgi:hypothetical protein
MMFLVSLLSILSTGVGYMAYVAYRRRKFAARSLEDILVNLQPVNLDGLRSIADCYLHPGKDQLRIEPNEMWEIVGGLKGIEQLKQNARIMLDLAVFAERWNWEQGPVISEMIRRDATRLNRAVIRLELAFVFHLGFVRAPFHLQEATSSYYLIRGRLLGLYQMSHIALVPQLEAAL